MEIRYEKEFILSNAMPVMIFVATYTENNRWAHIEFTPMPIITFNTRLQFAQKDFLFKKIVHELTHAYFPSWYHKWMLTNAVKDVMSIYSNPSDQVSEAHATFVESCGKLIIEDAQRLFPILKEVIYG